MSSSDYRKRILENVKETGEPTSESRILADLASSETEINRLLKVLADPSSSVEEKNSALNLLKTISVFSSVLPKKMPDYVNVLRGLLDDQNGGIRAQAFGALACMKDEVAQERLQAELESDKAEAEKSVPTHQAIAMLGIDEKALDYAVLRKIAEQPPSDESLVTAVRYLPANAESFSILRKVMEDDSCPLEARALVPEKINNIKPVEFLESVNRILKKKGAGNELAPYLARGVGGIKIEEPEHGPESMGLTDGVSLSDEISRTKKAFKELLESSDSTESLKKATSKYLFPEEEDGP